MQANQAARANIRRLETVGFSLLHVVQKAWCTEHIQARSRERGWEGKQSQITETSKESQTASCRHWEIIKIWNIIHSTFLMQTSKNVPNLTQLTMRADLASCLFSLFSPPTELQFPLGWQCAKLKMLISLKDGFEAKAIYCSMRCKGKSTVKPVAFLMKKWDIQLTHAFMLNLTPSFYLKHEHDAQRWTNHVVNFRIKTCKGQQHGKNKESGPLIVPSSHCTTPNCLSPDFFLTYKINQFYLERHYIHISIIYSQK